MSRDSAEGADTTPADVDSRIFDLAQQLQVKYEYPQRSFEEMQTANEELKSFNEEMQSMNEEMQFLSAKRPFISSGMLSESNLLSRLSSNGSLGSSAGNTRPRATARALDLCIAPAISLAYRFGPRETGHHHSKAAATAATSAPTWCDLPTGVATKMEGALAGYRMEANKAYT